MFLYILDSLVLIKICSYRCAHKLVAALEALTQEEYLEIMRFTLCRVPKQDDSHTCGWRVCLNAKLILNRILHINQVAYIDYPCTITALNFQKI